MSDKPDGLFEYGTAIVGTAARLGMTFASIPLTLLPSGSRVRVRRAMAEVARGAITLPKELASASDRVMDEVLGGTALSLSPSSPGSVGERARVFTGRLVRAAEDVTVSVSRAAAQVVTLTADQVERAAARIEEQGR